MTCCVGLSTSAIKGMERIGPYGGTDGDAAACAAFVPMNAAREREMHRLFSILVLCKSLTLAVLCMSLTLAASEAAAAIENPAKHAGAQSGLSLSYYCAHVPDLSVNRPDAVDDWLKICALYFSRPQAQNPPGEGADARAGQPPPNLPGPTTP